MAVLVLRDCTERPEAVSPGVAELVGTDPGKIQHFVSGLMHDESFYSEMAKGVSPYGDDRTSGRTVQQLARSPRRESASTDDRGSSNLRSG